MGTIISSESLMEHEEEIETQKEECGRLSILWTFRVGDCSTSALIKYSPFLASHFE